jgi:hypothetical protein
MSGSSTITIDTSGRGRVRRSRTTTLKRVVVLIIGLSLFVGLVKLIITLRKAGHYIVQAERPLRAGSVYNLKLSRSETFSSTIIKNDPDFPATAGESYHSVHLRGRAKIKNIGPRGVPNRLIIKIDTLRQVINSGEEQTLITDSGDIGVTRRVGGVFEVASKQPIGSKAEDALTFVLQAFMRPIPRDVSLNAIIDGKTDREIEDQWPLVHGELLPFGEHLIGGTVSDGNGTASLPREEITGDMPCLVLNMRATFEGVSVAPPPGFRLFQGDSLRVTTAHRLPMDPDKPVITRSSTTVLEGRGTPPGSEDAILALTIRTESTEDVR